MIEIHPIAIIIFGLICVYIGHQMSTHEPPEDLPDEPTKNEE